MKIVESALVIRPTQNKTDNVKLECRESFCLTYLVRIGYFDNRGSQNHALSSTLIWSQIPGIFPETTFSSTNNSVEFVILI